MMKECPKCGEFVSVNRKAIDIERRCNCCLIRSMLPNNIDIDVGKSDKAISKNRRTVRLLECDTGLLFKRSLDNLIKHPDRVTISIKDRRSNDSKIHRATYRLARAKGIPYDEFVELYGFKPHGYILRDGNWKISPRYRFMSKERLKLLGIDK